jgi:hypothetical protein
MISSTLSVRERRDSTTGALIGTVLAKDRVAFFVP